MYKSRNQTKKVMIQVNEKLKLKTSQMYHNNQPKRKNHKILQNWNHNCTFICHFNQWDESIYLENHIIIHQVIARQVDSDAIIPTKKALE